MFKNICNLITDYKNVLIKGIKYLPAIFALTTALKIYFLNIHPGDTMCYVALVHWVNIILTSLGIYITYAAGRFLNYCWKHRSLCRTAWFGILGYVIITIFNILNSFIDLLCLFYVLLVIGMLLIYKEIK